MNSLISRLSLSPFQVDDRKVTVIDAGLEKSYTRQYQHSFSAFAIPGLTPELVVSAETGGLEILEAIRRDATLTS